MAGIEHDGAHGGLALDHLRTELRLDCLCEIDARNQKFSVLSDDGETKPVAHAVDDGFAAVERELKLIAAVIEDDGLAGGIEIAEEAVELSDVVGAQVIARTDFDNLPVLVRRRRGFCGRFWRGWFRDPGFCGRRAREREQQSASEAK